MLVRSKSCLIAIGLVSISPNSIWTIDSWLLQYESLLKEQGFPDKVIRTIKSFGKYKSCEKNKPGQNTRNLEGRKFDRSCLVLKMVKSVLLIWSLYTISNTIHLFVVMIPLEIFFPFRTHDLTHNQTWSVNNDKGYVKLVEAISFQALNSFVCLLLFLWLYGYVSPVLAY